MATDNSHPIPVPLQILLISFLMALAIVPIVIVAVVKAANPDKQLTNEQAFILPIQGFYNSFDSGRTKLSSSQISQMSQSAKLCYQNRDCTTDCHQTRNIYYAPTSRFDPSGCVATPAVINLCLDNQCVTRKLPTFGSLDAGNPSINILEPGSKDSSGF